MTRTDGLRPATLTASPRRSRRTVLLLVGMIALSLVVILLPSLVPSALALRLLEQIAIFAMLALGLNLIFGYTGQISVGQAGFYAIGAYAAVILEVKVGVPWFLAWPAAIVITMVAAWAISVPLLRLKGHYLALGTLAFGLIVYTVVANAVPLTGGSDGLLVSGRAILGPWMAERMPYVIFIAFVVSYWAVRNLVTSSFGRALRALRDDEEGAEAMGIPTSRYKTAVFVLAAGITGLAGILYAHRAQVVTPEVFDISVSIQILIMVVIGGMASNIGSVIGATIAVLLPHALQVFDAYQNLIYAVLVLVVLLFEPRGVAGLGVLARRAWRAVRARRAEGGAR